MAAGAWDVLSKAANLAQLSGLHAAVFVAVLTALLRVYHSNRRECARLEQCHLRLSALLQWPASGGVKLLLGSQMGVPVGEALADAAGLVDSYKESTVWRRVRGGGRIATQLREMQDVIDSYWGFLLLVNAHLLFQQQAVHHHPIPPSSDTSTTRIPGLNNDASPGPSAQGETSRPEVEGTQRAHDIGHEGGMEYDPATGTGCERNVPADPLPIVISLE